VPYLQLDLIIQILLWLPVKSLIRFKSVCKSWFSLISFDPHFANSHFQLTASKHTHRLMFMTNYIPQTLSLDFEASLDYDTAIEIPHPNPNFVKPQSDYAIKYTSSCRGFIFLYNHPNIIYLWNPSTGANKKIPLSPFGSNLNATYYYGFGYDQLTDDYLVVSFSYVLNFDDNHIYSRLEFFSLRDSTWNELEGIHLPYMLYPDEHRVGSLFSGAIHWLAFHNDLARDVIIAFDLTERTLLEMSFPDGFGLDSEYSHLWVFGEFLSLSAMDHINSRVEIWVMKEYKVHSSWTKTLNLSIDGIPYFSPICSTKIGDIIGTNDETELLKYNDKGQLLERNSFWDGPCPIGSLVTMYTESLLSLPSDNVLP